MLTHILYAAKAQTHRVIIEYTYAWPDLMELRKVVTVILAGTALLYSTTTMV